MYNVVCPLINSIGSTQYFKLCIKQYGTEAVQKNSSSKTYFYVLLKLVEKYEKIQAYIGCKVAVTVKISDHLELQNKNEKSNRA